MEAGVGLGCRVGSGCVWVKACIHVLKLIRSDRCSKLKGVEEFKTNLGK